jgi:hypothetical protein
MHLRPNNLRRIGADVSRGRRLGRVALEARRLAGPVPPLLGPLGLLLHPATAPGRDRPIPLAVLLALVPVALLQGRFLGGLLGGNHEVGGR